LWTGITRKGWDDRVYGPEERLTPYQALRASTLESAWQFFEEDRKGSLEIGKLADLVILSANPMKVDPRKSKDIHVLETIKEGRSVFRRVRSAPSL
jgi:predicted amidohydrolase YtcJ